MANKITEKYFSQGDFSARADEVLARVKEETGFKVSEEIFRGMIYDWTKVGSLIYRGSLEGRPAALKLQGLKPEVEEIEMIKKFNAQNKSALIRLPEVYLDSPWRSERGYGYIITEYVAASKIFEMPFASPAAMAEFARFYEEYRTRALTKPWLDPEEPDSLSLVNRRLNNWVKISEAKGRLTAGDYQEQVKTFKVLAEKHLPTMPLVFSHGHLSANDIYRLPDGGFVLFSNLFWSWRPEFYDLAFNLWACQMWLRDVNYTFEKLLDYLGAWLKVYREIPMVKRDPDFDRKINMMLLERTMGAILVDLGAGEFYDAPANWKYFRHLLGLEQKLFDHLADKLKKF